MASLLTEQMPLSVCLTALAPHVSHYVAGRNCLKISQSLKPGTS